MKAKKRRFCKRADRRYEHAHRMSHVWWRGLHTRWLAIARNPELSVWDLGLARRAKGEDE